MRGHPRDAVIEALRAEPGNQQLIAEHLKITRQAVQQWHRIPEHRIPALCALLGTKPHQLRPDLYAPDGVRRPEVKRDTAPPRPSWTELWEENQRLKAAD